MLFYFGNGPSPMDLFVVTLASLLAGFVDSIVGGGGLILMPALFATFPSAAPATLFGTNKGASVWGTGLATWQYSRKVTLPWRALAPAAVAHQPLDRDAFFALVGELMPLLEENKFDAMNRFKALQAVVHGTVLADQVEALADVLHQMRFDLVLARMRQITLDLTKAEQT